ncbi:MAG TPA: hypothetical protein VK920_10215 [Solirubrobacterales bacterium]|nr:hypothetical protein [Solirubrobacterales bacterium]
MPPAPAGNGGFPEPPAGERAREVLSAHPACGAETRVRLPERLPARVVRRVVCAGCGQTYEADRVRAAGPAAPGPAAPRPPGWLARPPGRLWRVIAIPIAAAAVIATLVLARDVTDDAATTRPVTPAEPTARDEARVVSEPTYTLALPPGWRQVNPPAAASFAAESSDGTGEATLWIEEDAGLGFGAFERRSLVRLRDLAGSGEVAERSPGPAAEQTVVRLTAGAPGERQYEVTLRAAGPHRYFLSTSLEPAASPLARDGVALIQGSFLPGRE